MLGAWLLRDSMSVSRLEDGFQLKDEECGGLYTYVGPWVSHSLNMPERSDISNDGLRWWVYISPLDLLILVIFTEMSGEWC